MSYVLCDVIVNREWNDCSRCCSVAFIAMMLTCTCRQWKYEKELQLENF